MQASTELRSIESQNVAQTAARLARAVARAKATPRVLTQPDNGAKPFALIDGAPVDLEHLLEAPARKRERATLTDVASFIDYIMRHKTQHSVVLFHDGTNSFTAVLNYHGDRAEWADHTACYTMPKSAEWLTWTGASERQMWQMAFAEFVEENMPDIVEPPGANLLTMVQRLQAKKSVQFESSVRLDNGAVQFVYAEDIKGTVSKDKIDIPAEFVIGIAPFHGEAPFKLKARLRYRIDDKRLQLSFKLDRPHKVIETVTQEVRERIKAATGLTVWSGSLAKGVA